MRKPAGAVQVVQNNPLQLYLNQTEPCFKGTRKTFDFIGSLKSEYHTRCSITGKTRRVCCSVIPIFDLRWIKTSRFKQVARREIVVNAAVDELPSTFRTWD